MDAKTNSGAKPLSLKLIIMYKFLIGIAETLSGVALAGGGAAAFIASRFIDPAAITKALASGELLEDPNDLFANWIVSQSPTSLFHTALNLGLLLLFIGGIKITIAIALLLRSKRLHIFAVLLVALLTLFSILDILLHTTALRAVALAIEVITLFYLAKEVPREFQTSRSKAI